MWATTGLVEVHRYLCHFRVQAASMSQWSYLLGWDIIYCAATRLYVRTTATSSRLWIFRSILKPSALEAKGIFLVAHGGSSKSLDQAQVLQIPILLVNKPEPSPQSLS